jgi:hypothetical protein
MRKIKLTERELTAIENKNYIRGYELGYKAGKQDALSQKYTPNQIREILGLPPIEKFYFGDSEEVLL